jgi:hypothetical protein
MPQEPIEPTPAIEKTSESLAVHEEKSPESAAAIPEEPAQGAPRVENPVESLPTEAAKERAAESASPTAERAALPEAPSAFGLTPGELLKEPHRIRSLGPEEQVSIVLDLVVQKKFPVAHQFIEQLGKKEDPAFYAWLEDSLHDAATREDWRKFIEEQK